MVRAKSRLERSTMKKRKLNFENATRVACHDQIIFEFVMSCDNHLIERFFSVPFPGTANQIKYRAQKAIKELRQSFAVNKWERKKLQKACLDTSLTV